MNTAPTNDRNALCPLCSGTHAVIASDSIGDRGETVSAEEAVMVAHYRAEVIARTAGEFKLFVPREKTSTPPRSATRRRAAHR